MRGSPIFRLIVAAVVLSAAGVSTAMLTSRPPPAPTPAQTQPAGSGPVALRLVAQSPVGPASFHLRLGDEPVVELIEPGGAFECAVRLPNADPVDLVLSAAWSGDDAAPVALKLRIFFDGKDQGEAVFWGQGRILDVLALDPAGAR